MSRKKLFNDLIRFRASKSIKQRLAKVAAAQERESADLLRDATVRLVEAEEQRLGIANPTKSR